MYKILSIAKLVFIFKKIYELVIFYSFRSMNIEPYIYMNLYMNIVKNCQIDILLTYIFIKNILFFIWRMHRNIKKIKYVLSDFKKKVTNHKLIKINVI